MVEFKTRVAILLPTLGGGGAERVNINLANEFAARGIETDLVFMCAEGELLSQVDPRVRVVSLEAKRIRHILFPIVRYLREARPQVLMACMWPVTIMALISRVVARVPLRLVFSEHTNWSVAEIASRSRTRLSINLSMRVLYRYADAIIAVSKGAKRDLERRAWLSDDRVVTIYNPIVNGSRRISEPSILEGWSGGAHKRVIAVGTLKAIKDYPTLLRAFSRVSKALDARLAILGEGGERPELERLVRELDLDGRVFMPGFVNDPSSYVAQADLHVLSSAGEGFGNVIVEALEQGVPVVSTDCPSGPREILEDGRYGTLVPVGDVVALAHAMQEVLSRAHDPDALKLRAQAFSVKSAADAYLKILLGTV